MHTGKSYKLLEFLRWTRRKLYLLLAMGIVPVVLYQLAGLRWLTVPWTVVALMGTATAFIIGFKNTQTYNRTWDARQAWDSITSASRSWGLMCRDFLQDATRSKELIYRHFAWLTAVRYELREPRDWDTINRKHNKEYQQFYSIPETATTLASELGKYLPAEEVQHILNTTNKAAQVLSLQSKTLKQLNSSQQLDKPYLDMQKALKEFYDLQGKCERIKNFPYPRQYAIINTLFVRTFCFLLPFGMLHEFDKLNADVSGLMQGNMPWLVIPFSVIISWAYTSLEQVGESTANPFEGSANDVPISQISRSIEIDLREMLGETALPPQLQPVNNIIL